MNMPECCSDCQLLNDSYDYPECIITGETRGYNFKIESKMDECPLKLLPEKKKYHDGIFNAEVKGWNDFLDQITGK